MPDKPRQNYEQKLKRPRRTRKGLRGLREGVSTRELEREYLNYLSQDGQRGEFSNFLMSEGQLVLSPHLQPDEYQRLYKLVQTVQRNRQRVRQVLLGSLVLVLTIIAAAWLMLKSPLLGSFLENHLSQMLAAPLKIHSPKLHWNGRLDYTGLSIGQPGTSSSARNEPVLLELGPGSLTISLWALLHNKIVLNEVWSEELSLRSLNASESTQLSTKPLKPLVPLEQQGLIEDAKANFNSFRQADQVAQNFSQGKSRNQEIEQNQARINQNNALLSGVNINLVTPTNSKELVARSRDLYTRVDQQLQSVSAQLAEINTQVAEANSLINSLNSLFNQDFALVQQRILSGEVLQNPVSFLVKSYLRERLGNFNRLSLWLAALLNNLQQYPGGGVNGTFSRNRKNSLTCCGSIPARQARDYSHQFPALFYPRFALNYLDVGSQNLSENSIASRLRISALSSDGDAQGSPVVATFESQAQGSDNVSVSHLQLLYENRRKGVRRRHPSDCDILSLDVCTNEGSSARFKRSEEVFSIPARFFEQAALEFIRSYRAALELNIVVTEAPETGAEVVEAKGNDAAQVPALQVELNASLQDAKLEITGQLNALQQALVEILSDHPLNLSARFRLSEDQPGELLDMDISGNIGDILNSTLQEQGSSTFQNIIYLLRLSLSAELQAIIKPLQQELSGLHDYRYRLQLQFNTLNQQRSNAEIAPGLINRELERQKSSQFGGTAPQPDAGENDFVFPY